MAQIVLADEINRATPKTQSALLECMEERQATIDGVSHQMPSPFLVIATQNPIEYEGTFALPEAQLDRFLLRIRLGYPKPMEELVILDEQKRLHPIESIQQVLVPRRAAPDAGRRSRRSTSTRAWPTTSSGWSPPPASTPTCTWAPRPADRCTCTAPAQALAAINGRDYVIPDDVKQLAVPVLGHRLIVRSQASLREVDNDAIVREVLVHGRHRRADRSRRAGIGRRATRHRYGEDQPSAPRHLRRDRAGRRRVQHRDHGSSSSSSTSLAP